MQYDWSGDQLREKGHKGQVVDKIVVPASAKRPVNDIGHLLKGKKADTKRQQDVLQIKIRMEGKIYVFNKEVIIFEVK